MNGFNILMLTMPACIAIPMVICTGILLPAFVMYIFEKQRDRQTSERE